MDISDLVKFLIPPENPSETKQVISWEEVENRLNTKLPTDYKAFIKTYGTGTIGGNVRLYNPFAAINVDNLIFQVNNQLSQLRDFRKQTEWMNVDFPLYPETDGLLPIGDTSNSSLIFYRTSGDPQFWTITVVEGGQFHYKTDLSLSNFLKGFVAQSLKEDLMDALLVKTPITFLTR